MRDKKSKKKYDDDLLVELLARRGLTHKQVAGRVGISTATVDDIAAGRYRKDLHARIELARGELAPGQRRPRREGRPCGPAPSTKIRAEYDDELLISLIVDPRVPTKRIAGQLGISSSMVTRIAAGSYRPDLQPHIDAELRNRLRKQRQQAAGTDLTDDEEGASYRRNGYDDDLLVELIGRGDLTLRDVARRVGLTRETVRRIFCGKSRPELQPRIRQTLKDHAAYVRTAARRALEALVGKHIGTGLRGDDELARKCREFIMKMIWSDDANDDDLSRPLPRPGLTAEDYEAIALLKGGPSNGAKSETANNNGAAVPSSG